VTKATIFIKNISNAYIKTTLSNIQLEWLKVYASGVHEAWLIDIKEMIAL